MNDELPTCKACGLRTTCNLVLLGIDERWYLCPFVCYPAFLADAREWLTNEHEHNAQLSGEESPPAGLVR